MTHNIQEGGVVMTHAIQRSGVIIIYTTQTGHVMHMQCFRESSHIVEDYFHVVHIKSPEFILEKILLQLDKTLS